MSKPLEEGRSLVERRLSFLRRHREKQQHADQAPGQGNGPENRHGQPQTPVGQHLVKNWPVLDLGVQPDIARKDWLLRIDGLVENPITLDWDAFLALPQVEDASDFHCVTTWSRLDNQWKGVRFLDIAALVRPTEDARFLLCTGSDADPMSQEVYTANLSLIDALEEDVLLVHTWNGEALPREHGGPVRMITPKLYAWKGTKWINRISFLKDDQLGFWEKRGYSNSADPWRNDRYSS